MRPLLICALALLAAAAPAEARCAPAPESVLERTPAGTVAFQRSHDVVHACVRGGRPVRLGEMPLDGPYDLRLAGGFAAFVQTYCDRYYGGCSETRITLWNLRRGKITARREFAASAGDDVFGEVLDLELCARGRLAVLLRVGGNLELWEAARSRWRRLDAEAGRDGFLVLEGTALWTMRDGRRSHVGHGFCTRR